MESCTVAEQEEVIKDSFFSLVKAHIPTAQLSDIDEIVLSYVVGILDDLSSDPDDQDGFDVEGFIEMLSAYLPEFAGINQALVCEWIFKIARALREGKAKNERSVFHCPVTVEEDLEKDRVNLSRLNLSSSLSSSGRSRHSSSECSASDLVDGTKKRTHLLSENSDASSDSSGEYSGQEDSFLSYELQMLQEMFPRSSTMELRHCLTVAEGDVERAAQIVLHRQEAGQSISNNINTIQQGSQRQRPAVNDEELKSRIIARYSYVDKDDDVREHRPVPPKSEPKKLVRYRDNKIVSLKGERYTEVKREDCEESAKLMKGSKAKAH